MSVPPGVAAEKDRTGTTATLQSKLRRSHLAVAALGLLMLVVALGAALWSQWLAHRLANVRSPTLENSMRAREGLQRALAAQRGWMIIADPQFKSDRVRAWTEVIEPSLANLEELSNHSATGQDIEDLKQLRQLLRELKDAQWWIEEVAQTQGNQPALALLKRDLDPPAEQIDRLITVIIEIEKEQPFAAERRPVLATLADLRATFIRSRSLLERFAARTDEDKDGEGFRAQMSAARRLLTELTALDALMTAEQKERLALLLREFRAYENIAEQVSTLRQADTWNVARHRLQTEALPLDRQATELLERLSAQQTALMDADVARLASMGNVAVLVVLLFIAILILAAFELAGRSARRIAEPVAALAQATGDLAAGRLASDLPVSSNDEVGRLTESFNAMRRSIVEAEQSLRISEAEFRAIFETRAIAIAQADPKTGLVVRANERFCDLTGYSEEELAARTIADLTHPDDRAADTKELQRLFTQDGVYDREKRYVRKHGQAIWVRVASSIVRDAAGQPFRVVATVQDVSAQRAAHAEVERREERLRGLVTASSQIVWTTRADGQVIEDSPSWRAFTGQSLDELLGWGWLNALHPDDRQGTAAVWARSVETASICETEYRLRRRDGEYRLTAVRGVPLLEADGSIREWIGMNVDITEQRQSEERFRALADNMVQLAWMADETGSIFWYNRRWFEYTGTTLEEMQDWGWRSVHAPDHIDRVAAKISHCFRTGEIWDDTFPLRGKDGTYRWFLSRAIPIRNERGEVTRWFGSNTDITERIEAENAQKAIQDELSAAKEVAESATRAKGEFLANMSHEIRTPMNAIIGMAYLALKTTLSPKQHDYLSKIHRAAQQLLGIINDILDFSKIEAGKLDLETTDFRLDDVISSVTTIVAQKATDKGLELLAQVAPGVPQCLLGDSLRLGQILTNLINNSIKFTERGEVCLHAQLLERVGEKCELKIAVRDTGMGMTPEQSAKLFQPFTQADTSTTRKHGGTGLGLTVCRRLVELMGGQIWLESDPGVGTTFTFTVWLGIGKEKGAGRIVPEKLGKLRALIVDDNAGAREIMDDLLKGVVSQTDAVASALEALAAVKQADADAPYDVVFMDWRMPGMDGSQAARILKADKTLKHPPAIVMVTAFGRDEVREEAEHLHLDGFLVKPVTRSMLVDSLVNVFADPGDQVAALASATAEGVSLAGLRILLVEDNDINQQIAVELLEGVGAKIDVVNNGQEAVDKLFDGPSPPPYDVVLMDLQMPVMDGHQATAKIRSNPRFTMLPIYAMTAHATLEERDFCLAHGMNGHIGKPIEPALLFDALSKIPRHAAETTPVRKAPAEADGVPRIEGLDGANGLRRLGGNTTLYLKLLRQFAIEQADAVERIRAALAANDVEGATRLAHTLKGVAGSLGAAPVQAAAADVEQLLRDGSPKSDAEPALERLAAVLGPLLADLRPILHPTLVPSEPAGAAVPPARTRAIAAQLAKLFADFDTSAVTFAEQNEANLRPAFAAGDWERFLRLTQEFAFPDASALLDKTLAHWPVS